MEIEPWASRRGGGAAGARARGPGREAGATGGLGAWAAPPGRKGGRRGGGGAPPGQSLGTNERPEARRARGARGARGAGFAHLPRLEPVALLLLQPAAEDHHLRHGGPTAGGAARPASVRACGKPNRIVKKWLTRTETDATEMVCSLQPWGRRAKWPGGAGDPARAPAPGNGTGTRTLVCPFRFSIRVRGAEGTGQKTTSKKGPKPTGNGGAAAGPAAAPPPPRGRIAGNERPEASFQGPFPTRLTAVTVWTAALSLLFCLFGVESNWSAERNTHAPRWWRKWRSAAWRCGRARDPLAPGPRAPTSPRSPPPARPSARPAAGGGGFR